MRGAVTVADQNVSIYLTVDGWNSVVDAAMAVEKLDRRITVLATNTAQYGGRIGESARAMSRDWGSAAMQMAYVTDDLQYGMKGIVNNIPMLLTSFGIGMGLAGVVSVAAVGVNQLVNHWDDLMVYFDTAPPKIKAVSEQLAELKKVEASERTPDQIASIRSMTASENARTGMERNLESFGGTASAAGQEAAKYARDELQKIIPDGKTGEDLVRAVADARYNASVHGGGMAGQGAYEFHYSAAQRRVGAAMGGNAGELEMLMAEIGRDKTGALAEVQGRMAQIKADEEWERVVAEAEESGKAASRNLANKERERLKLMRDLERQAAEESADEEVRWAGVLAMRTQARKLAAMSPTQRRFAGSEDMSYEDRTRFLGGVASEAQAEMQAAQFQYATAGDPNAARMLRQQRQAMARFSGPGTALGRMQSQMAIRAAGGEDAIRQREEAQQKYLDASKTFEEAVKRLASDGVQAVIRG